MKIKNVFYLPSGRIFLIDCNGYLIESTEMRDVSIDGKLHIKVRESNEGDYNIYYFPDNTIGKNFILKKIKRKDIIINDKYN